MTTLSPPPPPGTTVLTAGPDSIIRLPAGVTGSDLLLLVSEGHDGAGINILGTLSGIEGDVIALEADFATLAIGATGVIDGDYGLSGVPGADWVDAEFPFILGNWHHGIYSIGNGSRISNAGLIEDTGIWFRNSNTGVIANSGTIRERDGMMAEGVENYGTIVLQATDAILGHVKVQNTGMIEADLTAIYVYYGGDVAALDAVTVSNSGTIEGTIHTFYAGVSTVYNSGIWTGPLDGIYGTAYQGSEVADLIRNSGTLAGAVRLNGGDDRFIAENSSSYLTGSLEIYGGAGADDISGGEQVEIFDGGDGLDRFWGNGGNDAAILGDGADWADGGTGDDSLSGGTGPDNLKGWWGADTIEGGGGDDRISGEAGNDSIGGGSGHDTIVLGNGDDRGDGNNGDDVIWGRKGADTIYGGGGNDILRGGNEADTLFGGDGADRLIGGNGADTLNGGVGADVLSGGDGADVFVFAEGDADGLDQIFDFQTGEDQLDFELGSAFLGAAAFSGSAGEIRAEQDGNAILVQIDEDGDGTMDGEVLLHGLTTLAASDFAF